jgi:cellulose biosynthesis protein BcsQ
MIVVAGVVKGGTGKSLSAANLAVARALDGKKVLAVDADAGQHNLDVFLGVRDAAEIDPVVSVATLNGSIARQIDAFRDRFDDIVIDCGGYDSQEMRSALNIADRWILPICPSLFQLNGLVKLRLLLAEANQTREAIGQPVLTGHVVGTRLSPYPARRSREMDELRQVIKNLNHPDFNSPDARPEERALRHVDPAHRHFVVLPCPITERYYWRDGEGAGRSVLELPFSSRDAQYPDLAAIRSRLQGELRKGSKSKGAPLAGAQDELLRLYDTLWETGMSAPAETETAAEEIA